MEQHTIEMFEQLFEALVIHEITFSDTITLGVRTTDDWEYPLPKKLLEAEYMTIVLTGWSKDETECTEEGMLITVAFGEQENSKLFKWEDIKGIFTNDGVPMMVKPYDPIKEKPKPQQSNLTLKDVMHPETDGLKKSMKIMRKLNPKKGNK